MVSRLRRRPSDSVIQDEDVQVEVSLAGGEDLYSIMVMNKSLFQSVVSVPNENGTVKRHSRRLQQSRYSQRTGVMAPIAIDVERNRRSDLMRNLSPINNQRSSLFDSDRHRRLRPSYSLQPIRSSFSDEEIEEEGIHRDVSLAPVIGRQRSFNPLSRNIKTVTPIHFTKSSRKPDLVSNTSPRGSMFNSVRNGVRKAKVAPK